MKIPMSWMWLWLAALWIGGVSGLAAQELSSSAADQRYHALSKELRCLVCQNESLAESPAGLADDLRQEVRVQIASGKTDPEIKEYLVQRYGYFVLYKPPFIGRTVLLWLAPLLVLLSLSLWLFFQFRRKRAQTTEMDEVSIEAVDEAQLEKIKKEFEQEKS